MAVERGEMQRRLAERYIRRKEPENHCEICTATKDTYGYDRAELEEMFRLGERDADDIAGMLAVTPKHVNDHFKFHYQDDLEKALVKKSFAGTEALAILDQKTVFNNLAYKFLRKLDSLLTLPDDPQSVNMVKAYAELIGKYLMNNAKLDAKLGTLKTNKVEIVYNDLRNLQEFLFTDTLCPACREKLREKLDMYVDVEEEDVLLLPHEMTPDEIMAKSKSGS